MEYISLSILLRTRLLNFFVKLFSINIFKIYLTMIELILVKLLN